MCGPDLRFERNLLEMHSRFGGFEVTVNGLLLLRDCCRHAWVDDRIYSLKQLEAVVGNEHRGRQTSYTQSSTRSLARKVVEI